MTSPTNQGSEVGQATLKKHFMGGNPIYIVFFLVLVLVDYLLSALCRKKKKNAQNKGARLWHPCTDRAKKQHNEERRVKKISTNRATPAGPCQPREK